MVSKDLLKNVLRIGLGAWIALGLGACQGLSSAKDDGWTVVREKDCCSGEDVFYIVKNIWKPEAVGLVEKSYQEGWEWGTHVEGLGTVLMMEKRSVSTNEGPPFIPGSYESWMIQLPAELKAGDTFGLRAIPASRSSISTDRSTRVAAMRVGDLVVFQFYNPLLLYLEEGVLAKGKVTILKVDGDQLTIRVAMKTRTESGTQFDVDDEFIFERGELNKG